MYSFLTTLAITAPLPRVTPDGTTLKNVLNVVFGAFGAIAVIVIVLAGLRYVLSQGDSSTVAKAKNAIIYAAIGLFLSLMAMGIVGFALRNIQ